METTTTMITQYIRPLTLEEAVDMASLPDVIILAGGTSINAASDHSAATVIDLQSLDLAGIVATDDSLRIGAMTRLQTLLDSDSVPAVLRDLARREAPSTIRNAATVGGVIGAAEPESELLAGLLAFGAVVTFSTPESTTSQPLEDILADAGLLRGAIMTSVEVPSSGRAATDRTGRTPMDRPIVMAVAYEDTAGSLRLAMTGVSDLPVIVDPERVADLDPPSDFRGSSEYRRHLAAVLATRVLAAVEGEERP